MFKYSISKVLSAPINNELESLFAYCVNKHVARCNKYFEDYDSKKTHNQWANYFFDYLDSGNERSEYMSMIKNEYKMYFSLGRTEYSFLMERVHEDFHWFFDDDSEDKYSPKRLLDCVDSELREAKRYVNIQHYTVEVIQRVSNEIYCLRLSLNDDDSPKFHPSSRAQLNIGNLTYYGKIIEYDDDNDSVYVSFEKSIDEKSFGRRELIVDMTFILEGLKNRVFEYVQNYGMYKDLPVTKIFTRNLTQKRLQLERAFPINASLDEAQRKAFIGALSNDISFIWGPPGTGKSFVLANIIRALYSQKEKTLVCCISNVAVDQLLNKEIDLIDNEGLQLQSGEFYRSGKTLDERIQQTDYLFPDNSRMERLSVILKDKNTSINDKQKEIDKCKDDIRKAKAQGGNVRVYNLENNRLPRLLREKVELENDRQKIQDMIKKEMLCLVDSSKVIFSTIANAIIDEKLNDCEFDNLIVDEASMLSLPYFLAIAKNVKKRIIISGDFRQLGTVSLTPHYCLRKNIYDYCGILNSKYECVYPLLTQRRSAPEIVNLINEQFYDGILTTNNQESDKAIEVINVPRGEVKYCGTTRFNMDNIKQIVKILNAYRNSDSDDGKSTIGIITPYKGQVVRIENEIDFQFNKDNRAFFKRIKVGTIHKFQGSECDWIIYDMVDARNEAVGRLYKGKDGEHLVNVALSRARHKLTVVGDVVCLSKKGGAIGALVSNKVRGVFNHLCNMIN